MPGTASVLANDLGRLKFNSDSESPPASLSKVSEDYS
jgi:hypothetical protein